MFEILLLYTLAAGNFTIAKAALLYSQPLFFSAVRMLLASSLIIPFIWLTHKKLPVIARGDRLDFALTIFFQAYLAFAFDLYALKHMPSSKGALLYNLSPFITAFFSYFIFKEKMTLKKGFGFLIGFLGFLPEFIISAPREKLIPGFGYLSWAELSMVASVTTAAFGWIIFRRLAKKGYDPLFINGIGMLGGGLLSLISSFVLERVYWNPLPATHPEKFILLTILITILANIVQYNLQGKLLKKYTATFLSFVGFITPLIVAIFGWFFLGETFNWTFFFSVFVVALGLAIFYSEELKQGYISRS